MANNQEKRIRLGVDVGELANQLIQVNNLVEKNYRESIQGQEKYNSLLDKTLEKLDSQSQKLSNISGLIDDILNKSGNLNNNGIQNTTSLNNSDNLNSTTSIDSHFATLFSLLGSNHAELIAEIGNPSSQNKINGGDSNTIPDLNQIRSDLHQIIDPIESINENVAYIYSLLNNQSNIGGGNGGGRNNGNNNQIPDEEEENEKREDRFNKRDVSNRVASTAVQRNEIYMLASLLTVVPFVGQGLGMIAQRLLQAGEAYDREQHRYRASSGLNNLVGDFEGIGLSNTQVYQKQREFNRANIFFKSQDIEFEKGYDLEGSMNPLLRSLRRDYYLDLKSIEENSSQQISPSRRLSLQERLRFGGSGVRNRNDLSDLSEDERNFIIAERENKTKTSKENLNNKYSIDNYTNISASEKALGFLDLLQNNSGISDLIVRGYSEEYLKVLVDVNQKQLEQTGKTNSILNSTIVSEIAALSSSFQDPILLGKMTGQIQQGLSSASSPQVEALQYSVLSQMNPDASLWELNKMRKNPFAVENRDYLKKYIETIATTFSEGGNRDLAYFNAAEMFNLQDSPQLAQDLIDGILDNKNGKSIDTLATNFVGDLNKGKYKSTISNEAKSATSEMQLMDAKMDNQMSEWGVKLIGVMGDTVNGLESFVNYMTGDFMKNLEGLGSTISSVASKMAGAAEKITDLSDILPSWGSSDTPKPAQRNQVKGEIYKH